MSATKTVVVHVRPGSSLSKQAKGELKAKLLQSMGLSVDATAFRFVKNDEMAPVNRTPNVVHCFHGGLP